MKMVVETQTVVEAHATGLAWKPKRTIEECDRIITAPGQMHETELVIIDDRVVRAYKHLPPVCTRMNDWL